MKKINNLFAFIVLIAIFSITSCSEVEPLDPALSNQVNSGNGNGSGSGSTGGGNSGGGGSTATVFKADFDGQTWNNASNIQAIVNSDYISISAMKSNGSFFQITVPQGAVGTYNWASATSITSLGLVYSAGSGQVPYVSLSNSDATNQGFTNYVDTAELVISSINTTTNIITGNFKFTGVRYDGTLTQTETKVFTNGQFSVPFTANNTSPSTNSFFCKLDGSDFIPTNVDGIQANNSITIIGRRGNIENISLSLVGGMTPGTYDLENLPLGTNNIGLYNQDASGVNSFGANPGTVTITTHDVGTKHIVGTFQFTGTSFTSATTHSISQGTFDVYYQ
ncbi:hypothetical protein FIA58_019625 [Flavobacterium jejuense]|uniref:Lipoprotein n=1 Tax=Flavobacterium jejuense TaxID=1544455 RepID=A0ABX0IW06_9FLAO|nr:DUF6252 family protein [Flavobacterium jejuense]NHN27893.1 hypothetical protein [Flavobacterium jejuense]